MIGTPPPFKPTGPLAIYRARATDGPQGLRLRLLWLPLVEIAWLAENAPEPPLIGPSAVLAVLGVLRRAGYLIGVLQRGRCLSPPYCYCPTPKPG